MLFETEYVTVYNTNPIFFISETKIHMLTGFAWSNQLNMLVILQVYIIFVQYLYLERSN